MYCFYAEKGFKKKSSETVKKKWLWPFFQMKTIFPNEDLVAGVVYASQADLSSLVPEKKSD